MPPPSQTHPACPSCAPAPATTSRTRCGPIRCVLMRFDAPHHFSMHPTTSQRTLPLLNVPRCFSMRATTSQRAATAPNTSCAFPTCHGPCPHASRPPNTSCVPFMHRQMVNGEDYVWPVNSLAFHPVCIARVCLCTVATDPCTDTTRSCQQATTGWCQSGTTRRRSSDSFLYALAPN